MVQLQVCATLTSPLLPENLAQTKFSLVALDQGHGLEYKSTSLASGNLVETEAQCVRIINTYNWLY